MDWGNREDWSLRFVYLRDATVEPLHIIAEEPGEDVGLTCCSESGVFWQDFTDMRGVRLGDMCAECVIGLADLVRKGH